jgi:hypothetical protein
VDHAESRSRFPLFRSQGGKRARRGYTPAVAASDIDPEWVAFTAQLKPAIRITVEPGEAEAIVPRFAAQGATVVKAEALVTIGGREAEILYVARSEAEALALRDAEAVVLPGRKTGDLAQEVSAHLEMGRRLGFPRCCVESFCGRIEQGIERSDGGGEGCLAEDYRVAQQAWVPWPDGLLNHFLLAARIRLITFYPCRYDCPIAVRYARAVLRAIARQQPAVAQEIVEGLGRPIAIAPSNARAVVSLGPDRAITSASAPCDSAGRVLCEADAVFAESLLGARVGQRGAVEVTEGDETPPPWVVPFAVTS